MPLWNLRGWTLPRRLASGGSWHSWATADPQAGSCHRISAPGLPPRLRVATRQPLPVPFLVETPVTLGWGPPTPGPPQLDSTSDVCGDPVSTRGQVLGSWELGLQHVSFGGHDPTVTPPYPPPLPPLFALTEEVCFENLSNEQRIDRMFRLLKQTEFPHGEDGAFAGRAQPHATAPWSEATDSVQRAGPAAFPSTPGPRSEPRSRSAMSL